MPSAELKKKGTFSDVVLPGLLVQATNARFTGMFRAERESIIKVIYFKEGEIAFASSNQPSDRLGEVLIKRGQLTREQLDMAMSKLEANVSLGRMLVELGYLSPKELLSGAKTQVEEILYSLNTWTEGNYEFVEGPLPPRIVDLKLNTRQVIFQCILQVEDRNWVLQHLGSMDTVFAPERYVLHFTRDRVVQRVGFAVRQGRRFSANPDLVALNVTPNAPHPLRAGADITLEQPGGRLRILAVHLKTGCREDKLDRSPRPQCDQLRQQLVALQGWIAQRRDEGIPFVLMGDFNRWMDAREGFYAALQSTGPLARATEGRSSPCWGGGGFVDHIIAGGAARGWMQADSLRVTVYREQGPAAKARLSDHCPVSARFTLPD